MKMIESFNDQRLQKRQRETGVYIKIARNTADIYIHIYICIYINERMKERENEDPFLGEQL